MLFADRECERHFSGNGARRHARHARVRQCHGCVACWKNSDRSLKLFQLIWLRTAFQRQFAVSPVPFHIFNHNSRIVIESRIAIEDHIHTLPVHIRRERGNQRVERSAGVKRQLDDPIGISHRAERFRQIERAVAPGDFGWSDVGSWDALWDISPKDKQNNVILSGSRTVLEDSEGSLIYNPRKLTALLGVRDLMIVETPDALLICKKGRSQDVKKIVETLEAGQLKKYL